MKVHIERNVVRRTIDIYVQIAPEQYLLYHPHEYRTDHVKPGQEARLFLRLEEPVMEAIIEALQTGDVLLPAPTARAALDDAKQVRDRLLALIERRWDADSGLTAG